MTITEKMIGGKKYKLYEPHFTKENAENRAKKLTYPEWDTKMSPIPGQDANKSAFKWGIWVRRK